MTTQRIVGYGDFNCPWSYLASRRATMLAAEGVEVEWRGVEHEPWQPRRMMDSSLRFTALREEIERVRAVLLPGEELPFSPSGFVPYTKASISGYAEAYGAGVGAAVGRALFEAFWQRGVDLGDAKVVRRLLADAIVSGSSRSELLSDWGYAVDVTGGPVTSTAWRLIEQWREQWRGTGKEVVPILVVDGAAPVFGVEAVTWLGDELTRRGVDVGHMPPGESEGDPRTDLASLSWVSQHGNRWLRDYQRAHREPIPQHAS